MARHEMLDNVSHRDLRIQREYRPGCGFDFNIIRAFPGELGALQNEYPLFLMKNTESDHFEPVAVLGFNEGENLYLADGRWDAMALPLAIERQPLLIGYQQQTVDGAPTQVPVVHIDLDHPSVNREVGQPLFLPHGGESEWLQHMTAVLKSIFEGHDDIPRLSQTLIGLELVQSITLDIEFVDGSKQSLEGLYVIDEERLATLPGSALETLNRAGDLRSIFMLLASLPNFTRLIEHKNARLRAQAQ
ncbi:MAG: SapC family protein [Wenzhouxiangellaceae bacterium]|nr:SapC family protein [Wenzhouxiangellaceae bacterium]